MISKLTDLEKSYFAGLFDGEGCVVLNRQKNENYFLLVTFNITYEKVLIDMKRLFGGSLRKRNMCKRSEEPRMIKAIESGLTNPNNWKQSYLYRLSGWDARCFLKLIEPFCREKKEQVDVAIEFEDGRKPGSKSDHEIKRGEFYYLKLQKLKKENLTESECGTNFKYKFNDDQVNLGSFEVK